jgi:ketosteroid isomerase-like protein
MCSRLVLALLASSALPVAAGAQQSDSAAVASVIERFHAALASSDSAAALALLAPDVTVLESGGVETLEEYRSHHLPGDIQFARAVPRSRAPIKVTLAGDMAWATSTGVTQGEFRGRAINSNSAELMVLTRSGGGWLIRAIHWSSRARR